MPSFRYLVRVPGKDPDRRNGWHQGTRSVLTGGGGAYLASQLSKKVNSKAVVCITTVVSWQNNQLVP